MKKASFLVLGVLFIVLLRAGDVLAVNASTTVKVCWRILPFQSLSIGSSGGSSKSVISTYKISQPKKEELLRGYMEEKQAITLTVVSNIPWIVQVRTNNENLGVSFDKHYVKPLNDFQLRAEKSRYITLSRENKDLAKGGKGVRRLKVDYKILTNRANYRPGNYRAVLIYTITSD